ncbi:MAG TPA: hypothetical protein DEB50_01875 [Desulfobacter sp.]|nr:hypothetical protein [Desulfobacter sp.]
MSLDDDRAGQPVAVSCRFEIYHNRTHRKYGCIIASIFKILTPEAFNKGKAPGAIMRFGLKKSIYNICKKAINMLN